MSRSVLALLLLVMGCTHPEEHGARPGSTKQSSTAERPSETAEKWRRCADAPAARQEVATAVLEGDVFIAGGLNNDGSRTDRVESYDTGNDSWTTEPSLPDPVDHAMAVVWRDRFVVLGGNGPSGPSDAVFALTGERWERLPDLPAPRAAGAAVVVDDEIVVVGGRGRDGHIREAAIFDGQRWRDGYQLTSPRDHVAAVTDGRRVFVVGGRRAGRHFGTVDVARPDDERAETLPAMPTARSGLGAAFIGDRLVAVGGEGARMFPEVEAYDIAADSWTRLPDMGVPRHGVGVVAAGDRIYALLGGTKVGLGASRACEQLERG